MTAREFWARTLGRFRRPNAENELSDEIAAHLEMAVEANRRQGMSDDEARRQAQVQFGTVDAATEQVRDQSGLPIVGGLWRDIRQSLRGLGRSPGFTIVTCATLALGIGLCSVFFSIVNGTLFRPLAGAENPDRLFATEQPVSYAHFEAFLEEPSVRASMAAWITPATFHLTQRGTQEPRAERIRGHIISQRYFQTIGVEPMLGRFFGPDLHQETRSIVLAHHFWRAAFGEDPEIVGASVRMNGVTVTVIGVGPPEFQGVFPSRGADVFVPVSAGPDLAPELDVALTDPTRDRFRVLLRLAPGETAAATAAGLNTIARRLDQSFADRSEGDDSPVRKVLLMPAGINVMTSAQQRSAVAALYAVLIGLILTLTCASLAGLVIARGRARAREVAVRLSLGASRAHLVRQLLTESTVLAIAGGAGGLAAAFLLITALTSFIGSVGASSAPPAPLTPDFRVALLTFAVAGLASVGFGLLPALGATRIDVVKTLKGAESSRGRGYRRFGVRNLFVVGQVATSMSLILVVGALVGGSRRGATGDQGFDTGPLTGFSMDLRRDGFDSADRTRLFDEISERLVRLPGVEGVAFAGASPVALLRASVRATVLGETSDEADKNAFVQIRPVGPKYFSTLGVRVTRGASLDDMGPPSGEGLRPAVLNEAAVAQIFEDKDPLGARLSLGRGQFGGPDGEFEIVGVVRFGAALPFVGKPAANVFTRLGPQVSAGPTHVTVRSTVGLDVAALEGALDQADSRVTFFNLERLDEATSAFDRSRDSMAAFNSGIAMFALVLACVGLAGVTAQAVERRRKEIGIEMALGAADGRLLRGVMGEGAAMVSVGVVLGCVAAFGLSRALMAVDASLAQLIPAGASAVWLIVGVPVALVLLALTACYLPARRALQLDPLTALRTD